MRSALAVFVAYIAAESLAMPSGSPCWQKPTDDGYDCICNAEYCDTIELPEELSPGRFYVYTSSPSGGRFDLTFSDLIPASLGHDIDTHSTVNFTMEDTQQEILGFGAALTDATGFNLVGLSPKTQERFLDTYFSNTGIEYSFVRVPIGGTDFSVEGYTNADEVTPQGTWEMKLQPQDCEYKIPNLQKILDRNDKVKFLASAWKAPDWMTTKNYANRDILDPKHYSDWAEYHKRFFDLYKLYNLTFWGATTGNELVSAVFSIGWKMEDHQTWINDHLGPILHESGYGDMKLLMMDDQTPYIIQWMDLFLNETTDRYISGVATHWYIDEKVYLFHDYFHALYPEKLLINTEASLCKYETGYDEKTQWYGAELYAKNILEKLNTHANGWIDWNLAVDEEGGPNYYNNSCTATVIVNAELDEFYKKPAFYAMGHFSKFIPPGSRTIKTTVTPFDRRVSVAAFAVKDKPWDTTVVILNEHEKDVSVKVCVEEQCAVIDTPARAIISAIADFDQE